MRTILSSLAAVTADDGGDMVGDDGDDNGEEGDFSSAAAVARMGDCGDRLLLRLRDRR